MNKFTIKQNQYLNKNIQCFCNYYNNSTSLDKKDNILNRLKNDTNCYNEIDLVKDFIDVTNIVKEDLINVINIVNFSNPVICTMPYLKSESSYSQSQLMFKKAISCLSNNINVVNGTNYIVRIKNVTFNNNFNNANLTLYKDIAKSTCEFNKSEIKSKNIILVSDFYIEGENIVEDCIQELFNLGAKNVILYAIKVVFNKSININLPLVNVKPSLSPKQKESMENDNYLYNDQTTFFIDLDDTLISSTELNNDAYNFALEQFGYNRILTKNRITRELIPDYKEKQQIIDLKQEYFTKNWLPYRISINFPLLEKLIKAGKKNCYIWTKADKNRALKTIRLCNLSKYFNDIVFDNKDNFDKSIEKFKCIANSNKIIIYENNHYYININKCSLIDEIKNKTFDIKGYIIN